ncbi:MAG: amino acid carrier protein [Myxococcota bacterium]
MIEHFFVALEHFNEALWGSVGVTLILVIGAILSQQIGWVHVRAPLKIMRDCLRLLRQKEPQNGDKNSAESTRGVSPARTFFASLGECVGIGNLVTVALGVQIGGPGVLVWIWVVAVLGMALKYGEVYLGIAHRRPNNHGSYDGGPMYVLAHAFPGCRHWLPHIAAFLLCVYGIEIYMFSVIKESIVASWSLPAVWVTPVLLLLIMFGVMGGVKRVGAISSVLIPLFGTLFLAMTITVLLLNVQQLPGLLVTVVRSAFTGHAAVGSFAGSTLILTVSRGLASACYSGDVGIGYASTIHSESRVQDQSRQASLSMLGIAFDAFICSCVVLLLLVTGVWAQPVNSTLAVQHALSQHFANMNLFMPLFLFCLGYTSIAACMVVGIKAASFLGSGRAVIIYWVCGVITFLLFSMLDARYALAVMSLAGACLMIVNCFALLRLRRSIQPPCV